MAATESEIRAGIKGLMEGVTDIGLVYDYERWAADWGDYLDLFKTTIGGVTQIRGWTITCDRVENIQHLREFHRKVYFYSIRGYMGLDDSEETEKTALGLAIDVVETLEQYPLLNSVLTNGTYDEDGWPFVDTFEPRMYGGVLCHYTEIRCVVFEKGTVEYEEG